MSVKWVLGAAAAAMFAASAEAGHHRSSYCRPCGGTVVSQNGWYHFSGSTAGMYVPFAPSATIAPAPAGQVVPAPAQPPMAQGTGVIRRFSYEPGTAPSAETAAGTVVSQPAPAGPTYAAAPTVQQPTSSPPDRQYQYGPEGRIGNEHLRSTVESRLRRGRGWWHYNNQ